MYLEVCLRFMLRVHGSVGVIFQVLGGVSEYVSMHLQMYGFAFHVLLRAGIDRENVYTPSTLETIHGSAPTPFSDVCCGARVHAVWLATARGPWP